MDSVKPAFKISPDFFKDLTWLIEKCDSSDEITLSDKGKYKYVIFYLKQIVATFLFIRKHDFYDDNLEQHILPNYVPFFKNPEFLFDDYIYHTPRNDSNKKKYLEKCKYPKYVDDEVKRTESPSMGAVGSKPDTPTGCLGDSKRYLDSISIYGFLKEFEYIFYYVLNRTDEYDFDVIMKKYPNNGLEHTDSYRENFLCYN